MTTAFVLAGGANLGALQVGMLRALVEADIRPDLVVGTSVGALNGCWIATDYSADSIDELAEVWAGLTRGDVFPLKFTLGLRGFIGRNPALFDNDGLRAVLEANLSIDRVEDTVTPLVVVATDVLTGDDVAIDHGPLIDAVMASSAIPGVYPPVHLDGRLYMDGAVSNNAPIVHAIRRGADEVFVLPTSYQCPLDEPPGSVLGMLLHALSVLVDQQLAADVERYEHAADVKILPSPCPLDVSPGDFSQTRDLIDRAYELTVDWLAGAAHPTGASAVEP